VSWWRAEGTFDDSVGPNNGTPQNVTFVSGVVGQAFHFAGNGGVSANATGLPIGASERTIEMWIKLDAAYPNTPTFVEGLFFGYGGWNIPGGTYSLLVVAGGATSVPTDSLGFSQWGQLFQAPPLAEASWHHVAATLSAGSLSIYLDGSLTAINSTATYPVNTVGSGSAFIGGAVPSADPSWLTGDVDEVSAYARALAPAEIQAIFQAGSAGKCP
jgi:hypothetical protein